MIVDLQRKIKIDPAGFNAFVIALRSAVEEAKERSFSVAFVSDRRMKELNKLFRGKNDTTDVLSFPFEADEFDSEKSNLGDIVISTEQATRQASDNNLTLEMEIKQLILHGALHLCGYDHETDGGEMDARELELRRELGIQE